LKLNLRLPLFHPKAAKSLLLMSILRCPIIVSFVLVFGLTVFDASAAPYRNPFGKMPSDATDADKAFAAYFRSETLRLQERCLADIHEVADLKDR